MARDVNSLPPILAYLHGLFPLQHSIPTRRLSEPLLRDATLLGDTRAELAPTTRSFEVVFLS